MIKVKHLMDAVEDDDGQRIWVEPHNLTRDLRDWCRVDHVLPHLGPSIKLWTMLDEHPDSYEAFRGAYHQQLRRSPYRVALQSLAVASRHENFTLVHASEDGDHNAASALHEYLSDLEAYCPPE
ncbi:MAG TPA: DUF488 family protein [Tepidisphaeraceae bacterium]|jgi:uncharacterized protein YeaO (DUF488 family)